MSYIDLKKSAGGVGITLESGERKTLALDAGLNDSDKIFAVPVGKQWDIHGVYVSLATTATAGNRQMEITIDDSANTVWQFDAGAVQAANLTYKYLFAPSLPVSALVGTTLTGPLPQPLRIRDFWRVRLRDRLAIDAAADDMTVVIVGIESNTDSMV